MAAERTQVCIIGAGPAGLLLALMLAQDGIRSIVIERRTRDEIEGTVKAGVLEHPTVELFNRIGAGERMMREGFRHDGIELAFGGRRHRVDLADLTGGKFIMVYPQHEVIKDLIAAALQAGCNIIFGAHDAALHDLESGAPFVTYEDEGGAHRIDCDFVAGCDGFHGPSRQAIPADRRQDHTRTYPCGWFGILCEAPPSAHELIYAQSERGFALISTRTPAIQRMYFQCDPHDSVERWSDEAIWAELQARVATNDGWKLNEGKVIQKNIVAMRSFVCETMHYGRLFLAGDAAHIVPPTGAKGLNLAVGDALALGHALVQHYRKGNDDKLATYSATALQRIWQVEYFSWWMTDLLHDFEGEDSIHRHFRRAQLERVTQSRAAAATMAENYVGLPFTA